MFNLPFARFSIANSISMDYSSRETRVKKKKKGEIKSNDIDNLSCR